jgi:hypothetical protein
MGACKGGFRVLAEIYEETCHAYRFLWARKTGFEPVIVEPDEHAHWWE